MDECEHFSQISTEITIETPETTDGCYECLKIDGTWLHLRQCMACGKVHCCDSSPNQHATKHYKQSSHPVVKILEQPYLWCYVDEDIKEIK